MQITVHSKEIFLHHSRNIVRTSVAQRTVNNPPEEMSRRWGINEGSYSPAEGTEAGEY